RQVPRALGALEEAAAHPLDQLAAGGERGESGQHFRSELRGGLLALDGLRAQVGFGAKDLPLLLVEERQRQRGAESQRRRRERGAARPLLRVLGGERHLRNALPPRQIERGARARFLLLERAEIG